MKVQPTTHAPPSVGHDPKLGPIGNFMLRHYRHFNAREMVAAAQAYRSHLDGGGKMLVAMAGAMSTAELGVSLAEMIRQNKVHAISCTAANLEEDVFNLVAHDEYRTVPNYRDLSPEDEVALRDAGFNRVTDTCIPEDVIRHIEGPFMETCAEVGRKGESLFCRWASRRRPQHRRAGFCGSCWWHT